MAEERTETPTTLQELVDALLLYDEPILNSRFHQFMNRLSGNERWQHLQDIPRQVTACERLIRWAAFQWESKTAGPDVDEFASEAERVLLEAFLHLVESQLRLIAYLAKQTPDVEVRGLFDEAALQQRQVAQTLRDVIPRTHPPKPPPGERATLRLVQEETEHADLRGQVEGAIHRMRAAGKEPRQLIVSHTALRHLRDQGLFHDGHTTVLDVPVLVDLEWEASAFAIQSFQSVSLDELTYMHRPSRADPTQPS